MIDKHCYVDRAEEVILQLKRPKPSYHNHTNYRNHLPELTITTSKIRSILALVSTIYNETRLISGEVLTDSVLGQVQYLRMRLAYESGRDRDVSFFVSKAKLIEELKEIGDSKERLILFCRYMEALVAYHKFHGGKD